MKQRTRLMHLALSALAAIIGGCAEETDFMPDAKPLPEPPTADRRPHTATHHGIIVEDPYHWLKDDSYPTVDDADVLAYLEAENRYFEAAMAPHGALGGRPCSRRSRPASRRMRASVPVREGAWFYQWRYEEGGQYRIWSRWPANAPDARLAPTDDAETILDEPSLAQGLEYFRLGALAVSNGGQLMAYSTDTNGSERFRLVVKDLSSGELLEDAIEDTIGTPVWAADDSAFLYTVVDENWRPYQVRRHRLGEPTARDTIVYEESDPGFFVGISASASKQHLIIHAADHVTSEVYLIPADDLDAKPRLVAPRRAGHEYSVDHQGDRFIIRTNDRHKNTRLATASGDDLSEGRLDVLAGGIRHTLHPRLSAVRGLHRRAGARGRPGSDSPDRPRRQERPHRFPGSRLCRRPRQQSRVPDPRPAFELHLDGYPQHCL